MQRWPCNRRRCDLRDTLRHWTFRQRTNCTSCPKGWINVPGEDELHAMLSRRVCRRRRVVSLRGVHRWTVQRDTGQPTAAAARRAGSSVPGERTARNVIPASLPTTKGCLAARVHRWTVQRDTRVNQLQQLPEGLDPSVPGEDELRNVIPEFADDEVVSLRQCTAGQYSATPGSTNCSSCPAGTFSSSQGSTSCILGVTGTGGEGRTFSTLPAALSSQK